MLQPKQDQTATIVVPANLAQEQLASQQQQQQQHLWNNSQGTAQRRDSAHTSNATSLDDVFMLKDDTVNPEDGEMDEIDRELEEFKRFCLMNKPLENRPKVAVKVNLKNLGFKKI